MNGMPFRLRALVHSSDERSSTKAYLLLTRHVTTGFPGDVFKLTYSPSEERPAIREKKNAGKQVAKAAAAAAATAMTGARTADEKKAVDRSGDRGRETRRGEGAGRQERGQQSGKQDFHIYTTSEYELG